MNFYVKENNIQSKRKKTRLSDDMKFYVKENIIKPKNKIKNLTEEQRVESYKQLLSNGRFGSVFVAKNKNKNERTKSDNLLYILLYKKNGKIIASPCGKDPSGPYAIKLDTLGFTARTSTYLTDVCELTSDDYVKPVGFEIIPSDKKRIFSFLRTYYYNTKDDSVKNLIEGMIEKPMEYEIGDVLMNPYDLKPLLILNKDKNHYYAIKLDSFNRYARETPTTEYDFANMVFLKRNEYYKYMGRISDVKLAEIKNEYIDFLHNNDLNQGRINNAKKSNNMIIVYKNSYYFVYSYDADGMKTFRLQPVSNKTDASINLAGMEFEPCYNDKETIVASPVHYDVCGYVNHIELDAISKDIRSKNKIGKYRTK